MNELGSLMQSLRLFAEERDWEQFHSPKNLATALAVEASEILEHFQWLTESESASLAADKKRQVGEEISDVFLYLLRLSDKLGIDLLNEAERKIKANALKYPVEKSKGKSTKYTDL